MRMKRIIEDLNNNSRLYHKDRFCLFEGTNRELINSIKDYIGSYLETYFNRRKITVQYETDEFYEYLKSDSFFAFTSPDFFEHKERHNMFLMSLTRLLCRKEKIQKELADDIIHHYSQNNKKDMMGEETINPYPNTVTLYLTIPISNEIPTFSEYMKIRIKNWDDYLKKENEMIESMNTQKGDKISVEDFLRNIRFDKKSKARKFDKKIEKYDVNGKLIETYSDRQECIEKNNFDKSALSKHLSGKRKKLKGYIYKEVD